MFRNGPGYVPVQPCERDLKRSLSQRRLLGWVEEVLDEGGAGFDDDGGEHDVQSARAEAASGKGEDVGLVQEDGEGVADGFAGAVGGLQVRDENVQGYGRERRQQTAAARGGNFLRVGLGARDVGLDQVGEGVAAAPVGEALQSEGRRAFHQREDALSANDVDADEERVLRRRGRRHDSRLQKQERRQGEALDAARAGASQRVGHLPRLAGASRESRQKIVGEPKHSALRHRLRRAPRHEAVPQSQDAAALQNVAQNRDVRSSSGLPHDLQILQLMAHARLEHQRHAARDDELPPRRPPRVVWHVVGRRSSSESFVTLLASSSPES
eukprot:CAMPEP_0198647216 /NCGR_PEP_ID=MMETSP1467-20131203/2546_1 /TAXON_ID=1462469 /ORGANISM="unid. sp., Strain CCMP2135" /LENGTH=325 /DNA_ID=CAMNT_0044382833 /DNA_START=178 /DNA_END=1155 /DNA_ORIENTATION=+